MGTLHTQLGSSTSQFLKIYGCISGQDGLSRKTLFVQAQLPRIKELKLHTHCDIGNPVLDSLARLRWKSLIKGLATYRDTLPHLDTLELGSDGPGTSQLTAGFFTRIATGLREIKLRHMTYPLGAVSPALRSLTLENTDCSDPHKSSTHYVCFLALAAYL